ncbi:MAG: hypothetical protein JWQ95_4924 [Sphaerisporangium sp.]|nr:hypothetical protein [Sphaerisporangium sp.]
MTRGTSFDCLCVSGERCSDVPCFTLLRVGHSSRGSDQRHRVRGWRPMDSGAGRLRRPGPSACADNGRALGGPSRVLNGQASTSP